MALTPPAEPAVMAPLPRWTRRRPSCRARCTSRRAAPCTLARRGFWCWEILARVWLMWRCFRCLNSQFPATGRTTIFPESVCRTALMRPPGANTGDITIRRVRRAERRVLGRCSGPKRRQRVYTGCESLVLVVLVVTYVWNSFNRQSYLQATFRRLSTLIDAGAPPDFMFVSAGLWDMNFDVNPCSGIRLLTSRLVQVVPPNRIRMMGFEAMPSMPRTRGAHLSPLAVDRRDR